MLDTDTQNDIKDISHRGVYFSLIGVSTYAILSSQEDA